MHEEYYPPYPGSMTAEQLPESETYIHSEQIGLTEPAELGRRSDWVAGFPETDSENWHKQSEPYSCAISCQEFVAEQLLDREFHERDLLPYAERKGWYRKEAGTTISDVGNLLEDLGLAVKRVEGLSLNDLADALDSGEKAICGVCNMILANPALAELPGFKANHAVEVIGIDASDISDIRVILNDPGIENGKGIRMKADTFLKAWSTSGNYAVIAGKGGV